METRSTMQNSLDKTLNSLIEIGLKNFNKTEHGMILDKTYHRTTSKHAYEKDGMLIGGGLLLPKYEGLTPQQDSLTDGDKKTYTHTTYSAYFRVTMEAVQDDMFAVLDRKSYTQRLNHMLMLTYEYSMGGDYDGGYTTTTTADGYSLYNASHPIQRTGLTASNTSTPTALSETSIKAARLNLKRTLSPEGMPMGYVLKTLLVPPELYDTADIIINSSKRAGTSDNDKNTLQSDNLEILESPFLSSTTGYHCLSSKSLLANKFYMRMEPFYSSKTDDLTGDQIHMVVVRFSHGWTDWRGTYGNEGA